MSITTRRTDTRTKVFLGGDVSTSAYTNIGNQNIPYTDVAASSKVLSELTTQVVVTLTTNGYIAIGSDPTATSTSLFLPANVPSLPLKVTGGVSKISAVRADYKNGDMFIAEYL